MPPGTPRARLATLRAKFEQGWPSGLTLLLGDDHYHLDAVQQALLDSLVDPAADEFGLTVYGSDKVDVATVVAAARSVGMFAERRVVLVRDAAALDGEPDALVEFAKAAPRDCYLIVRAESLDRRRKLPKALAKVKQSIEMTVPDKPHLIAKLAPDASALAGDKGMKLPRGPAQLLVEICHGDFYRVDAELEKIRAWLGASDGAATVTPDAIREVATDGGIMSGFEIGQAVLARDLAGALGAVRRLTDRGEAPIRLLGGLAWRCRGMVQAKATLVTGGDRRALTGLAGGPHRIGELVDGVGRYTMDELVRFPSYLLDADRTMKSRAIDPRAVLETTVERMIGGDRRA